MIIFYYFSNAFNESTTTFILKVSFLSILLFCSSLGYGQKESHNKDDEEFPTPIAFPYEYLGSYFGNLRVSDNTGVLVNVPTEFILSATENKKEFIYRLNFLKGKNKESQIFKLIVIDESKGLYAIKDPNGLEFTAVLIDQTLFSTFEMDNKTTLSSFKFTNTEKVYFSILVSKKGGKRKINDSKIQLSNVVLKQEAKFTKQ